MTDTLDPHRPLAVGDVIHGFANGAFGRDSYDCRVIEAIGKDWIVTRNENGIVEAVAGRRSLELCQVNRERRWDGQTHHPVTGARVLCCDLPDSDPPITTWRQL